MQQSLVMNTIVMDNRSSIQRTRVFAVSQFTSNFTLVPAVGQFERMFTRTVVFQSPPMGKWISDD